MIDDNGLIESFQAKH